MQIIRSAEALARALDSPLDPELLSILHRHSERLSDYADFAFEELATIVVIEAGERLADAHEAQVRHAQGTFLISPEQACRHIRWIELIFILSDCGFGEVLLVEQGEGADPHLIAACEAELG